MKKKIQKTKFYFSIHNPIRAVKTLNLKITNILCTPPIETLSLSQYMENVTILGYKIWNKYTKPNQINI